MYDDQSSYRGAGGGGGGGGRGNGGGRGPRGPGGGGHWGGPGGGRGGEGGGRGGGRHDPDSEGRGIPLSELDPALTEVSRRLIGCAIEVHKTLGPGYDKGVYHRALEAEMKATDLGFKSNHSYPVMYRGNEVGQRTVDLVIADRFVVDLMAQRGEVTGADRTGLRALLRAADMELGLIINFAERRLKDGLVRVLNPDKLKIGKGEGEHVGEGAGPDAVESAEPHPGQSAL